MQAERRGQVQVRELSSGSLEVIGAGTRKESKKSPALSPKKASVAKRAEEMVRRLASAGMVRGSSELAEERAFALKNALMVLRPGDKRQVRAPQLLKHEKAGEALVAEVNHILEKAKDAMSSEDGFLETDEVKAVKQDLALAALLFRQQGGNIDREERAYLNRLLKQFAPIVAAEGDDKKAVVRLEALFRARAKSAQARSAVRSLLGSSEMNRLASAIEESATRTSSRSAAMSASRSSQRGKRARAAVLRKRKARYVTVGGKRAKERSADTRSAGTASREFVRSRSGSLRAARTATRTSSRSFRPSMIAKINEALKDMNIAQDRLRRGAKPILRFGHSLLAIRQLEDIVKQLAKVGPKKQAKVRELRVEFIMTLLLQTPMRLSAESRDRLARLLGTMFKDRDAAALAAIVNLISKKKSATPIKGKSQKTRRLSKYIFKALEKVLTKSEIKAVNKEIDHVSSLSARSLSSMASTPSSELRRKRVSRRVVRSSSASSKPAAPGRVPYLARRKAGRTPPLASRAPLQVL